MELQRVITTKNPEGFVVIDDIRFPVCIGGIRLIKGVDETEVKYLAQAMSLKLHSFNLPMSGAKGGINSDNIEDFYKFISNEKIKGLISGKNELNIQFITGPDIGTSEELYYEALENADLSHLIRQGLLSQDSVKYQLPLDNIVTALGVVVTLEESLLKLEGSLDSMSNQRIVIEGFGKVGTGIARILKDKVKLVGISSRYGAIYSENGFNVDELIEKQRNFGDKLIDHMNTKIFTTEELFSFDCDVLIPGARTQVITEDIARKIIDNAKPKLIVPVSNAPYTVNGRKLLEQSGIYCFPDFIVSAGAVIAAMIEFGGYGQEKEALMFVRKAIGFEIRKLLKLPPESIYDIAEENALRNKQVLIDNDTNKNMSIEQIALKIVEKYYPELLE